VWFWTSRSSRLALAALLWTLVGLGLLVAGAWFAFSTGWKTGASAIFFGLVLGAVKGRFLLAKMARDNAARIESGPGLAWLGAMFPLSSWGIAVFFMVAGLVLRRSGLPLSLVGFMYVAAGFGLLVASLSGWRAWHRFPGQVTDP
jgi:hypothetical protein